MKNSRKNGEVSRSVERHDMNINEIRIDVPLSISVPQNLDPIVEQQLANNKQHFDEEIIHEKVNPQPTNRTEAQKMTLRSS